jgi:hypothetical protein
MAGELIAVQRSGQGAVSRVLHSDECGTGDAIGTGMTDDERLY